VEPWKQQVITYACPISLVSADIKGKTVSIVNALVSMGVDSSFAHRTKLAVTNGVVTTASEYKRAPAQNTALLKLLKLCKITFLRLSK